MKKLLTFSILTYLLITINSGAVDQSTNENNLGNEKILRVGVLLPLSGEFQDIGESFLKAIQLALYDISNEDIKIYPKDTKGNALNTYQSAKEFEKEGIEIVIGPIFYENLERLEEINNITFISLTNKTQKIPNNIIAFGINIESQMEALKKYFDKIEVSKTLLLSPKSEFIYQSKSVAEKDILQFYRTYSYDTNPKKITGEIEKITKYKVNFDSVVIVDFGERLKSVLSSFMFSDVPSDEVNFFTINQWFDESLFNENAMQNLHFPSIDFDNLKKFKKNFLNTFDEDPNEVSILAYDALGLIYYCWSNNNFQFKQDQLYTKEGFKGLHGEFFIENNLSKQKLKIYQVSKNKFVKVY